MAQNILLDSEIRDWVLLPLLFILFCLGLLRHYVTLLLNSKPAVTDVCAARHSQVAAYCRLVMQTALFLPSRAVRTRVEELTAEGRGLLKQKVEKADQLAALSSPNMMQGMLKQNITGMLPNILMMSIAGSFFGGFVVARFPFVLSPKFKGMLQQGVAIDSLECAYVTSLSLVFLCMFALNGVMRLVLAGDGETDTAASMMAQMDPMMAMAAQQAQQPGQDMAKIFAGLEEELRFVQDHHNCVIANAPLWLLQGR
jgi:hypothetical protein